MIRRALWWAALLGLFSSVSAQQEAQIDFFAGGGGLETDYNKDGRVDFVSDFVEAGVEWTHITRSLDTQVKYRGSASQRIQLQRSSGAAGRYVIFASVDFNAYLKPEVGEPLLVRVAIRAQNFRNATYQVYVSTGSRRVVLLSPSSQMTTGWQVLSGIVPVELDASGQPQFSLQVEISAGEGAAEGTLWIDEMQAISARTVMRNNTLPNGLRIAYSYLYRNQDGYRYLQDVPIGIVLGGTTNAGVILRKHYPNALFAPYAYFSSTLPPAFYRYNADLYNYDDVEQNHPDWFLLGPDGQRIALDGHYYVDIGRQDLRERAWQSLRDFMDRCGRPPYVVLDNVDMRVGPGHFAAPPNYPTNDLWVQAVVGWFEYVGSRLRNEFGTTFIPNAAWAPAFWLRGRDGSQDAPGVATLPYMGGFLIEHAFTHARGTTGLTTIMNYGTTGNFGNWRAWTLRDQIRLASEYPDKVVILIPTLWLGQPDTPQKLRFAVAGCLIVQHDNTYVQIDPRHQQEQYPAGFYPPELLVPLGRWTENFRILNGNIISGGLFVRNYENGIVVWNPCHDRDFTFTVPRDLYDWDRNLIRAGTVVQIPRQTGHVFYSAPEITVEISPQSVQVLPGQTVQFTVTYRNRGTAAGTNVRIAVPLPQGMTLVGSDPQARLENGQVVWAVLNVPVGGTGTLRFTVRVE